jgi:hypothetical protein
MGGIPRNMTAWTVAALLLGGSSLSFGQAGPQDNWVFEPELAWGSAGSSNGQFNFTFGLNSVFTGGIAADATNLFVCDVNNHRIQVFDKSGAFLRKWGTGGSDPGQFVRPEGLAVDSLHVFVSDQGNNRIQVFTKDGSFVHQWGGSGSGDGLFASPRGLAADAQRIYVADVSNNRIQVFDKSGAFITKWGSLGSVAGQFNAPQCVAVDEQYVYVLDAWNKRIQVFDLEGTFVRSWSLSHIGVPDNGLWISTFSLAVDAHNVYVGYGRSVNSPVNTRFQVFNKYGDLLWEFSAVNTLPLRWPAGIVADNPLAYIVDAASPNILPLRRIFRTLGPLVPDAVPLADVLSVSQRNGQPIIDVDYLLTDPDDSTVTVYAAAFVVSTNVAPHLADLVPMRTFVEDTATNIGPGLAPGSTRRLSWDMQADALSAKITNFGNVKVSILAKDDRGLLDLHFLGIPAVDTNVAFEISREPLYDRDFLPVWFWLLAAGDTNVTLSTGQVVGVGGSYNGLTLASGTNTTADGRSFLYERLQVRAANANEMKVAREASTPGTVAQWTPRRDPPPAGYKVNAFNFVTSPTNGWWVVPLP